MTNLPQLPGNRVIRALQKADFSVKRQSGFHVIMRHRTDLTRRVIIPVHGSKPVKKGTLNTILKAAKISIEELVQLSK